MLPILPPGTLVVATDLTRRYKPGHVVVILHEGREKIKRIQDIRPGALFVVGDNQPASTDSRHFGWIPTETIRAKVIWPRRLQ